MSRWALIGGVSALTTALVGAMGAFVIPPTTLTSPEGYGQVEGHLGASSLVTTLPSATVGSLTCPGTADKDTTPSILVQSVDHEQPSQVAVRYLKTKGATPKDESFTLNPGERKVLTNTSAAVLDWSGGPIQGSVVDAVGGLNSRVNCATSATDQWDLVGFDTRLGATSTLVLANPTTTPAVANLTIATPNGPVNLSLASGISVEPLNQTEINLGELLPETPAFAVRVTTTKGRVVASGELVRRRVDSSQATPTFGEVTGRARVVGIPAPTDQAFIPALGASKNQPTGPIEPGDVGATQGVTAQSGALPTAQPADQPGANQPDTDQSAPAPTAPHTPSEAEVKASRDHQLIIANPNEDQVSVDAVASAPIPGAGVLAAPITVPGGSVAVIKMRDISTLPNPGLVVTSKEGLPIVAAVRTVGDDLDITNGVNAASREWVVTAVEGAIIALTNPGGQTATITMTSRDGEQTVQVGSNGVVTLPSPVTGAVQLASDQPVVVSLRTVSAGWSIAGAARAELTGGGLAPVARRVSSKVNTPALGVDQPLPVQPPVDLVPGTGQLGSGEGDRDLPLLPGANLIPELLPATPTPGPDASPSTSDQPLPLPENLPAAPDAEPGEVEDENIFG